MPATRRRGASSAPKILEAGQKLKREALHGSRSNLWSWVGTEATDASRITDEHLAFCCGLSKRNGWPVCRNKYAKAASSDSSEETKPAKPIDVDEDVIVISDDEQRQECSRKACKLNPNCLNYLGQEAWEDEEKAREAFLKAAYLGHDPRDDIRKPGSPVGLKNLGATCYANAFLQVWFQDLAFRSGVYKCLPSPDEGHNYQDSPVFQLQVTFAAMQKGLHKVFNPTKLVESLQLRATEQQDAQEFSKLFMSYLDSEFKKQSVTSLKTLVPDQFQGNQIYGTECQNCHNKSERNSEFLELEISLERNCKLEERIRALLQPELLSGDNQYLCSHCDSLQDATRYTRLDSLPPVLHISLLRFVYDLASMERKKCSHAVSFPMTLDMDQFLDADHRPGASSDNGRRNVYHLRGVLLHKGPSAWHGHYEAQVYDVSSKQWYQFDDESVTKPKSMAHLFNDEVEVVGEGKSETKSSKVHTGRQSTKRKKEMQSSEDRKNAISSQTTLKDITSKEAYMLIYVRETSTSDKAENAEDSASASVDPPAPPGPAMEVINSMNAQLVKSTGVFDSDKKAKIEEFEEIRRRMRDVYSDWTVSSYDEPSVIVSADVLRNWLSTGLTKADTSAQMAKEEQSGRGEPSGSTSEVVPVSSMAEAPANSDSTCEHGLLDPSKVASMKRVKKSAYERMKQESGLISFSELSSRDVCRICVTEQFKEQLYQREHPKEVARFNKLCIGDCDSRGYWISKAWLKDWKLSKPKMHQPSSQDPAPDSHPFGFDVCCEHGCLYPDKTLRRTIPELAYKLLKAHFPAWQTLSVDEEPCAACEVKNQNSKEEQSELMSKAELEKTRLHNLYQNALEHDGKIPSGYVSAVVPADFVLAWREWVRQPNLAPRPDKLDNSSFLCHHGMLLLDLGRTCDVDGVIALLPIDEWRILEDLYSAVPLISVESRFDEQGARRILTDRDVCEDCRIRRKLEYTITEVHIRIYGEPSAEENAEDAEYRGRAENIVTYGSGGTRRSKRIRRGTLKGNYFKISVSKETTIKDLRLKVQETSEVPVICQRLFYRGQELDDSSATIGSLGILSNDVIDVQQASEEAMNDESEHAANKKPRIDDGRAFDGTMLGRQCEPPPDATGQENVGSAVLEVGECSACTYRNVEGAQVCIMCETQLM
ncbi:cysteine proteinase [Heliocybe sulcata]|uniref:ubiquitinyl hydrolase 1 n=1 Tax=Heliocybe sulcata TaxID=5364 RepID=A0A5C3NCS9_9AGAM|nr:cysteine proteinase [Heliocybe sulcata]